MRGRRGRFGTLLEELECGVFGRTAVGGIFRLGWPTLLAPLVPPSVNAVDGVSLATTNVYSQPFSQKSRTPTVAKEFQIGLCGVVEAYLELFCNCWSAGFLGERL